MRLKPVVCIAVTSLFASLALAIAPAAGAEVSPEPRDHRERRLIAQAERQGPQRAIVEFAGRADRSAVMHGLSEGRHDYKVLARYRVLPMIGIKADSETLRELADSPRVKTIYPDVLVRRSLASSVPLIGGDDVHREGYTGSGQTIAVLDDGIDRDHPFVGDRVVAEACFSSAGAGQTLCPDGTESQIGAGAADAETAACVNATDHLCEHGTHVAGIAAGSAAGASGAPGNGVAPDANIIAIQVFTRFNDAAECTPFPAPCLSAYTMDVTRGLDHLLTLSDTFDIAAANLSLGSGRHESACSESPYAESINRLLGRGIVTVVAAGNADFDHAVTSPACFPAAVAVGATDDSDNPADWPGPNSGTNRGDLLDLFAPGSSIVSSVTDDAYAGFNGTSMAAPHVAGAFAVLSEVYPGETPAQLLTRLRDTGVPIMYDGAGTEVTTPRIDLLAAAEPGIPDPPEPPTADAGGPYTTDEGAPITLQGSGANASAFAWDLDGDGAYDDATGTTPTFDRVGQDAVHTVSIRATGPGGTATDDTTVTVENVRPAVTVGVDGSRTEGAELTVSGEITDPGWLDPLTATVDVGPGAPAPLEGDVENDRPDATLSFSTTHVYGDNGTFTITVCGRDDDTRTCRDTTLTIANIDPEAAIDTSGAVDTPEGETIVTEAGDDVGLSGRVTDPGSDDLTATWDFGDGEPSPDKTATYLVNPPDPDPPRSPTVQPRDVTDEATATYEKPCVYEVTFAASDDDGGSDADQVAVVVQGNGLLGFTATPWHLKYTLGDLSDLGEERLNCYLEISRHMSAVFSEERAAGTLDDAQEVLAPVLFDSEGAFDRQLLAAWLNFAHGSLELDEKVDTDGLLHPDTTFIEAVRDAEAVRLDPGSTAREISRQAAILTKINLFSTLR